MSFQIMIWFLAVPDFGLIQLGMFFSYFKMNNKKSWFHINVEGLFEKKKNR